jgi:hypothetical protein
MLFLSKSEPKVWFAFIKRVPPNWNYREFDPKHDVFPVWPEEQCTHFQWWQDKTDTSPVSPVFATIEEMVDFAQANLEWPYFTYLKGVDRKGLIRVFKERQ